MSSARAPAAPQQFRVRAAGSSSALRPRSREEEQDPEAPERPLAEAKAGQQARRRQAGVGKGDKGLAGPVRRGGGELGRGKHLRILGTVRMVAVSAASWSPTLPHAADVPPRAKPGGRGSWLNPPEPRRGNSTGLLLSSCRTLGFREGNSACALFPETSCLVRSPPPPAFLLTRLFLSFL